MRLLFVSLLVLAIAATIAMLARDDPGLLVINFHQWSIETSAVFAVIVILAAFAALYYAIRFIATARRSPKNFRRWQSQRRLDRASDSLTRGLLELAKGDWSKAERVLIRHAKDSKTPLLNYLAAARAAQKQDNDERRDYYLKLAHQNMPKAEVAIGLTQAELQMSQGQMEQALATLTHLQQRQPKHSTVLKLLMRLYIDLHDWERLLELVPVLQRRKVLTREQAEETSLTAYRGLLQRAIADGKREVVFQCWQRIPKTMRLDTELLISYAEYQIERNHGKDIENLIYQSLNRHWNDRLAYLYGLVDDNDMSRLIKHAEGWLLTLGRLCRRQQLWSRAEEYLQASIRADAQPENCRELAQLLEQRGKQDQAMQVYRRGLMLTRQWRQALPDAGNSGESGLSAGGIAGKLE